MRPPTLVVRVQLPLEWNAYLLFNTDIVNFAWKTDEGETKSSFIYFCSLSVLESSIDGGGRKSYLGPAEIASFSSRSFHISIKFRLNLKHRSFLIFYYVWKQAVVRMFFKIGVRKNFASLTGKHLCWSLFLITLRAL